jgi:hypothetical protein
MNLTGKQIKLLIEAIKVCIFIYVMADRKDHKRRETVDALYILVEELENKNSNNE